MPSICQQLNVWLCCVLASLLLSGVARAATIQVDDTADELNSDGSCSLREAIQAANTDAAVDGCAAGSGADVIQVPAGTYTLAIAGADEDANLTGDLDVTASAELVGAGRESTILDGAGLDRVLDVRCTVDIDTSECTPAVTARVAGLTIRNGDAPSGRGGGFRNTGHAGGGSTGPNTLLEDVRVTGNTSTRGGGVGDEGVLTIRNCLIDHNEATVSAGGGVDTFGRTVIEESEIANNEAAGQGGGVYNNALMAVRRTLIRANTAGTLAGGYIDINGLSRLENVTVTGNTAGTAGGGVACGDLLDSCEIRMSHVTIYGNTSGSGGGGLAMTSSGSYITQVKNSIIAGNGSVDVSGTIVSNDYNLVQNVGSSTGWSGAHDQLGISARLTSLADHGGRTLTLALKANSPAIDAASCTDNDDDAVTTDQRGVARPLGDSCDIGAFEWMPSRVLRTAAEPSGVHCASGGVRIESGPDANLSGELDDAEVDDTKYACNGAPGPIGMTGASGMDGESGPSGAKGDPGPSGVNGMNGERGAKGDDGERGPNGENGEDGKPGANALVTTTELEQGSNDCEFGGLRVETGTDLDGDAELDDAEISDTHIFCAPSETSCSVTAVRGRSAPVTTALLWCVFAAGVLYRRRRRATRSGH